MVIIKLPESSYKSSELFKKSQFSKMFTKEEVDKYFINKPNEKAVLVQDKDYKISYTKKLNKIFNSTIKPEELEGELEFPIRKSEEIFNNHLKKKN